MRKNIDITPVEKHVLRSRMAALNLSTQELSEKLGTSRSYLNNAICGSIRSRALLNRLATLLALPAEPGFGFVEFRPKEPLPVGSMVIIPKETANLWQKVFEGAEKDGAK